MPGIPTTHDEGKPALLTRNKFDITALMGTDTLTTPSHTCEQNISLFVALSNVLAVLVKSFQNVSPKMAFRMDCRVS